MHEAGYLRDHPDAAPVGPDGKRCPAPDGWQGVCPTHPEYRRNRMETFRQTLAKAPIDGIWLDYHHAHASWEQAEPNMPDTCFCPRCLETFAKETGAVLPEAPTAEIAKRSWASTATAGFSGGAIYSPPGFATSARSSTKPGPEP